MTWGSTDPKSSDKFLPNIIIDLTEIGYPGYYIKKLDEVERIDFILLFFFIRSRPFAINFLSKIELPREGRNSELALQWLIDNDVNQFFTYLKNIIRKLQTNPQKTWKKLDNILLYKTIDDKVEERSLGQLGNTFWNYRDKNSNNIVNLFKRSTSSVENKSISSSVQAHSYFGEPIRTMW